MLRKIVPCCLALICGVSSLHAVEPSTKLQVSEQTSIPGSVLAPGNYTLRVVDHLSDRYILKVEGGAGAARPSFLGIPNTALKGTPGEIKWAKSPNQGIYLRGWNFTGVPGSLEFVYPKDDAVALAKANGTRVAAIDPGSEGRVSNNCLSKDDMQMVTLWLLSPTHVGPGDTSGGIKAERYAQVAAVAHKQVVSSLPHTASCLPVFIIMGLLSLISALGIRVVRVLDRLPQT